MGRDRFPLVPTNELPKGLIRRKTVSKKTGKLRHVGAVVIDIHVPVEKVAEFSGMKPRFVRTTEVYVGDRNAETTVKEMKLMVKELIRSRDKLTLKKIEDGSLSLASAHKWWREGRVHLAQGYEKYRVVKEWLQYYDEGPFAEKTKTNRRAIVAGLVSKGYLTPDTVVNELPGVLKRARKHYELAKQAPAFNTIRIEMGALLTKGLGMDSDSPFVRDLMRVPQLKQGKRREPHSFETPRECAAFCKQILERPSPHARLYVESVLFMCKHGLRPEEFEGGLFKIDPDTDHLWVGGTKNVNAKRVAPLSSFFAGQPPKIGTLNMLFKRMGSPVRCRDFRRTFALWAEAAGIPQARVSAYLGHGAKTMTQRYQRTRPQQATLDQDRDSLHRWQEAELARKVAAREKTQPKSGFREIFESVHGTPTAKLKQAIADQEEQRRRTSPRRPKKASGARPKR